MESAIPVLWMYASARAATERGSRLTGCPVRPSRIAQSIDSVGASGKWSSNVLVGSGTMSMSLDSVFANPGTLEPSKPSPWRKSSGVSPEAGTVTWCHLPSSPQNLRSTMATSCRSAIWKTLEIGSVMADCWFLSIEGLPTTPAPETPGARPRPAPAGSIPGNTPPGF